MRDGRGTARRTALGLLALVGVALTGAGCTDDPPAPGPQASTTATPPQVDHLTFGVYGPSAEIEAFRATVRDWNATTDGPRVELETWTDRAQMRATIGSGRRVPDVFLAARSDLEWLLDNKYTQPVDELLDERGVDFGDGYSRDALQAFSADSRLQCMPYGVSPMVIYYNTDLVRFDRMRRRGLDAPDEDATNWSFEQFAAAAEFASRPERGTKGVHIAATLSGLWPFVVSGGGSVFDDGTEPTSTALASDGSRDALERTLQLLRNPQVTLGEGQLERATPLTWFERGKLGMIAGYRNLVPELRRVRSLHFDVMPMPVLDSASTIGDVSGLCLSRKAASTPAAADFLVHELSAASVGQVTRTGYLDPANLEVALSNTFLQPHRRPQHAAFYNSSVRSMTLPPLMDNLAQVEQKVESTLEQLVYGVGVLDLEALTEQVDAESRTVLDPESVSETPSPSTSPSSTSSGPTSSSE